MNKERIILIDNAGDGAFLSFLEKHLSVRGSESFARHSLQKETSSSLDSYLLEASKANYEEVQDAVHIYSKDPRTSTDPSLRCAWEGFLERVSIPLALVCLAGGSRAFINLLKCWVEERKNRKISIKDGDREIVIEGGVTRRDIDRAVEVFEKRFGRSRIISP